jgi:hypothetical protein
MPLRALMLRLSQLLVMALGPVLERRTITEQVSVNGGSADLVTVIPVNSRIEAVQFRCDNLPVFTTATKIGLGVAADPDKFAISGAGAVKNTKVSAVTTDANGASATAVTLRVSAVDNAGAAAGSFVGKVSVRVVYKTVAGAMPDA